MQEASIASVMEDVDQANRQRGTSLETANATLVMGSEKLQGVCKHFQGLIQNGMREYSNVKQSGKKTTLFVRSLHNLKVTFVRCYLYSAIMTMLRNCLTAAGGVM